LVRYEMIIKRLQEGKEIVMKRLWKEMK